MCGIKLYHKIPQTIRIYNESVIMFWAAPGSRRYIMTCYKLYIMRACVFAVYHIIIIYWSPRTIHIGKTAVDRVSWLINVRSHNIIISHHTVTRTIMDLFGCDEQTHDVYYTTYTIILIIFSWYTICVCVCVVRASK